LITCRADESVAWAGVAITRLPVIIDKVSIDVNIRRCAAFNFKQENSIDFFFVYCMDGFNSSYYLPLIGCMNFFGLTVNLQ
jgi:hypothetical protein